MYVLVTSCVSSINTSWGCVLFLLYENIDILSIFACITGTCAGLLFVVNFLFDEAAVFTLVLALLSRGVSYQSGALTVVSFSGTCVVITLEFGGSMPGVLAQFFVDTREESCGWLLVP